AARDDGYESSAARSRPAPPPGTGPARQWPGHPVRHAPPQAAGPPGLTRRAGRAPSPAAREAAHARESAARPWWRRPRRQWQTGSEQYRAWGILLMIHFEEMAPPEKRLHAPPWRARGRRAR